MKALRPPEIVEALDHHIVGQASAKRAIAVAIRNRWRSQQAMIPESREFTVYRYLVAGPRGVGKSQTIQQAALAVDAPFVRVSALQLAATGTGSLAAEAVAEALVEAALGERPIEDVDLARKQAEQEGIILIDGLDRWVSTTEDQDDERLETAQRSLYRLAGATHLETRYGRFSTHDIMMFATGNLTTGRQADLPLDLQILFPKRIDLQGLSDCDLLHILSNPESSPVNDYVALLETEGLHLQFTTGALEAIAAEASELNRKIDDIGARRLAEVIETVLDELLYDDASAPRPAVVIDKQYVQARMVVEREDEDLDDFIL
jgi:ATP-dependent protease HslVU (ClpYQ) ATPase subunit